MSIRFSFEQVLRDEKPATAVLRWIPAYRMQFRFFTMLREPDTHFRLKLHPESTKYGCNFAAGTSRIIAVFSKLHSQH